VILHSSHRSGWRTVRYWSGDSPLVPPGARKGIGGRARRPRHLGIYCGRPLGAYVAAILLVLGVALLQATSCLPGPERGSEVIVFVYSGPAA